MATTRRVLAALVLLAAAITVSRFVAHAHAFADARAPLRVCADPNNLPFSNQRLEGFENRLMALAGAALKRPVEYVWWPQRRGFVRMTLQSGLCDVIAGVPTAFELARTTRPYYRSTYVFLSKASVERPVTSLDDSRLRRLRVGVQMVGDDFANSPPAHALSARGVINNVVGFSVLGDYAQPNPPSQIVTAVANGNVDVAVVWGPLAGFFGAKSRTPLVWHPVTPTVDPPFLPFAFDISMAVRREDDQLHGELDRFILDHAAAIAAVLDRFHVPQIKRSGR